MAQVAIGIDVGGTWTRVAAVDSTGRVLAKERRPTPVDGPATALLQLLGEMFSGLLEDTSLDRGQIQAAGLALPGLLDPKREVLVRSLRLPFLEDRPVRRDLSEKLRCPLTLMTDAEAATWAEYAARVPRPRRFVHLRLGTGIACGVVGNGQLQRLDEGRTSHLPVLVIDPGPDARVCSCGRSGCLETVASGPALAERAERAGYPDGLGQLQLAWQHGETPARELITQSAAALTASFANLTSTFRPDVICLGGGVVTVLPALFEEAVRRYALPVAARKGAHIFRYGDGNSSGRTRPDDHIDALTIEPAGLGDDAGVIGAALLARRGR